MEFLRSLTLYFRTVSGANRYSAHAHGQDRQTIDDAALRERGRISLYHLDATQSAVIVTTSVLVFKKEIHFTALWLLPVLSVLRLPSKRVRKSIHYVERKKAAK
jgi:hypothetical protein